jgi:hypothetical protein
MRMARSATRRSGGWWVQEFSNKIVCGIEYTLDLAGNATAPQREVRSRGRRGGTKTGRRMAVQGAAEPVGRLAGAIQGDVGPTTEANGKVGGPGRGHPEGGASGNIGDGEHGDPKGLGSNRP